MTTHVSETAIIDATADSVWNAVKTLEFKFLPTVKSVELEGKGDVTLATVGGIRKVVYNDKDHTTQSIRLVELSDAQRFVSYDIIASNPPVSYTSAIHTIRVRRVTESNGAFIEFVSDFSRDASRAVIEDSRHKKLEFFKALAAVTEPRASQFLRAIDFSTFKKLTSAQIEEAWAAFDTDKNGTLEPAEVEKLVGDILVKIAAEQSAVHKQLKSMFASAEKSVAAVDAKGKDQKSAPAAAPAAAAAPVREASALSARVLEDAKKKTKGLAKSLMGRLDKNRDGKIDRSEFVVLFPAWFESVLSEGVRAAYF